MSPLAKVALRLKVLQGIAALCAAGGCVVAGLAPSDRMPEGISARTRLDSPPRMASPDQRNAAVLRAVERNPFRADRRSAHVRFVAAPEIPDPAELPPPELGPAPHITVLGLVAGSDPLAILAGIPGAAGPQVLGPGEMAGSLEVQRVSDSGVDLAWGDTTWVVTYAEGSR